MQSTACRGWHVGRWILKAEQGASVQTINERGHIVYDLQILDVGSSHGEILIAEDLIRRRCFGDLTYSRRCWDGSVCDGVGGAVDSRTESRGRLRRECCRRHALGC